MASPARPGAGARDGLGLARRLRTQTQPAMVARREIHLSLLGSVGGLVWMDRRTRDGSSLRSSGTRARSRGDLVDRWLPKIRGNFSLTPWIPPQLLRVRFETERGCAGMRQRARTEGEQDLATVNGRLRKVLVAQA